MKKVLITIGIILGVVVVAALVVFGYLRNEMKDFKPAITERINDTTFVVFGMSDMYLIGKGTSFIAIDAGGDAKKIAQGLASLSINPDYVKAVFLTHTDSDHTAALPLFKNATVYLAQKEVPVLTGQTPRHFMFITHKNTLPVPQYKTLADVDSVIVDGQRVNAVLTPGHTVGSMSYIVGSMVFVGDLLILRNGAVEPMIKVFTEDRPTDSLSIRHVASLPNIDFLGTAHTGFTRDMNTAFAKWK